MSTAVTAERAKSDTKAERLPGQLYVLKRNPQASGEKAIVDFDAKKITLAITKAFMAVEGEQSKNSVRVQEQVKSMTQEAVDALSRRLNYDGMVHVEDIQDQVERVLMRNEHYKIARAYVLYREERRRAREAVSSPAPETAIRVTLANGQLENLDVLWLQDIVVDAVQGLTDVSADRIFKDTIRALFDGIKLSDLRKALILSTRPLIEIEPNYSLVAARLLLNDLWAEAATFLKISAPSGMQAYSKTYPAIFKAFIDQGVALELLSPELKTFDLDRLANHIQADRDFQFNYLGLQTLYDRYFLHSNGIRFELPQTLFMRVAMGLAINEKDKNARAIEFYDLLSSFQYMTSTPTLFNAGTLRPQLSSCFLTTVPDDLSGIFDAIKDNALLSKYAGGLGNDWTAVRSLSARIKGTNGKSSGVGPFLKVANDTAVAVNQGGKRKGSVCAYLETWHLDIEEFLELRKNTGDERRRTHDMNTANWVPDLFMRRVAEQANWTLFSPDETPDLHDKYGQDFEDAYARYEALADQGKILNFKRMSAVTLWRKMLGMIFETGHPWITFKDPCNIRSPQQHCGVIHSSNLCTEITLNTSVEEIAVCNLGSINLVQHLNKDGIDKEKLQRTIKTAVRMLDNVIDINYYAVPQAKNSNMQHRPVGLGLMGFQDALYQLDISYASNAAVSFADESMELISYYAIEASVELAKERGSYASFQGSLWNKGILPIDSIGLLKDYRKGHLEMSTSTRLSWDSLREKVKQGIRNSNLLAIAPTATISNICGVSQSIEPTYQNLYVKSNLSGEFTVINAFLVNDLKSLGLWDDVMVNDLKYYNGSVQNITRIPATLRLKYATAFEIDTTWLIEAGSRRQKWIDQSQSLNLYIAKPSGKIIDSLYRLAWLRGLKTTYYCRTLGASDPEKSTVTTGVHNAVQVSPEPQVCPIDDPSCEACQ